MSSGDKGGVTELIKVIKSTKVPIFCVCNDYYDKRLKSLVTHCLSVKFFKPNKMQMTNRLKVIVEQLNMNVDSKILDQICESSN